MATYPVKNKETGETKEVVMSIHDWDQWNDDNPDWERYYTPDNREISIDDLQRLLNPKGGE